MSKKLLLGILFVMLLFISPFIATGSGLPNNRIRSNLSVNSDGIFFPFWYFCHVNTSGTGRATHSGNNMFIAIEYDDDINANTTLKSFFKEASINGTHKIQLFFFIGDSDLPLSGMEGECSLNGMAMMIYIW